jgi:hypothetical protein
VIYAYYDDENDVRSALVGIPRERIVSCERVLAGRWRVVLLREIPQATSPT